MRFAASLLPVLERLLERDAEDPCDAERDFQFQVDAAWDMADLDDTFSVSMLARF